MSIRDDINNILQKDPAARSWLEVCLCYPGFHAILIYRVAHKLWIGKFYTPARFLSHIGRMLTGIEIHPGAVIGERVLIDHGMGVVIGETAEVGDDSVLYQGITLGAGKEAREGSLTRGVKRHPTLGKGVIVGSGAEIQGALTIGDNVRVASGSIVLRDVPADSIVVGVPGRVIYRGGQRVEDKVPDIEAEALKSMKLKVEELERKLEFLTKKLGVEGPMMPESCPSDSLSDASQPDNQDPVDVFLHGAGI